MQEFQRLRRYITSLEASVSSQRKEISFLRDCDGDELNAIYEDSEAQEYDTDPDDSEPLFEHIEPKTPVGAPTTGKSIDDSSAIPTPTVDNLHPHHHTNSLASVSVASQSLHSLCAATSTNMMLASPGSSTSATPTVDPLVTPH